MGDQDGTTDSRREEIRAQARKRLQERQRAAAGASGSGTYAEGSYSARLRQNEAQQQQQQQDSFGDRLSAFGANAAGAISDALAQGGSKEDGSKRGINYKLIALVVAAVVLLAVVIGTVSYCVRVSSNLNGGVDENLKSVLVETDMANEPFYMLLLGTDGSAGRDESGDFGDTYRSDTIILARIDAPNKLITLVSIHRDTLVDLGGEYGEQKINAAYAFGGPALAVEAVSKLAGVEISHYAEIDFDAFVDMVDALGGVEVDIPIDINDPDAGGSLKAGTQTLTGEQALVLCRARETYNNVAGDPDAMRAANQRMVITAIARKLLSSDVATIASTVEAMSEHVTTTLQLKDLIGLAQSFQGIDPDTNIYSAMQPVTSEYKDDIWWAYTDEAAWKKMMDRVKQGLPPTEADEIDEVTGVVLAMAGGEGDPSDKYAYVTVKNGTAREGLAAEVGITLTNAGFVHVDVGAANSTDYQETVIVYDDAAQAYEAQQIQKLLGQGRVMKNPGDYFYEGQFLVLLGADWKSDTASAQPASAGDSPADAAGDEGDGAQDEAA